MKSRSSLLAQNKTQVKVNNLSNTKSKTELNTPEFAYAVSPDFCGDSSSSVANRYAYSRKNSRNKTMAPSPFTLVENEQFSPILDRRSVSPDFFKPVFSFNEGPHMEIITPETKETQNMQTSQVILSAYESLHQLRQEAKSYFISNQKFIKESQRSRRSSIASEEYKTLMSLCNTENGLDPFRDLAENINLMKKRVLLNELNNEIQINEDYEIKSTLEKIEKKLEVDKRVEKTSVCVGCNTNCCIF